MSAKASQADGGIEPEQADPANSSMIHVSRNCVVESDGLLDVGVPVGEIAANWPGYYPDDGYQIYTIQVVNGVEDSKVKVRHETEGQYETMAFSPDSVRQPDEWPDRDYEYELEIAAPIARGILGAMSDAADEYITISTVDGVVSVHSDGEGHYWEFPLPSVECGGSQKYSAWQLSDLTGSIWPTGAVKIRFGEGEPLEIEHEDGMKVILAPRLNGDKQ